MRSNPCASSRFWHGYSSSDHESVAVRLIYLHAVPSTRAAAAQPSGDHNPATDPWRRISDLGRNYVWEPAGEDESMDSISTSRLRNSQSSIGGAINALKLMQAVGLELEE